MGEPAITAVAPSPFQMTVAKIVSSSLGIREDGFQDEEQFAGFRKHDLAAFGMDLVSFACPPLFAIRVAIDKKAWKESPGLQTAMMAFAIVGCFPMVAAGIRAVRLAQLIEHMAIYAVASRVGALAVKGQMMIGAPLMILQAGAAICSVTGSLFSITKNAITGERPDSAAERGEILRASLQLVPLAALRFYSLNRLLWPRREMVRAARESMRRLDVDEEAGSLLALRENALNPFPSRGPIADRHAPKIRHTTEASGRQVLEIDYTGVPVPRRYLPGDLDDIRVTVSTVMDSVPVAMDRPLALARMAEEWGRRLLMGHGIQRVVHRGIENIPAEPITIAQLTHYDPKDIFAICASGPHLGLMISQLGKKALGLIPGMRQAVQCNLLNPTGHGFLERSVAHLRRLDMPRWLNPANHTYTSAHRATRRMVREATLTPVEQLRAAGIPVTVKPNEKGVEIATWMPTQAEVFLPHRGVFLQANATKAQIVPVTHRYLDDGTIEFTWYRPVRVEGSAQTAPDTAGSLTAWRQALTKMIREEIVPNSDYLRFFHDFYYLKPRQNPVREILWTRLLRPALGRLLGRRSG